MKNWIKAVICTIGFLISSVGILVLLTFLGVKSEQLQVISFVLGIIGGYGWMELYLYWRN